MVTFIRLKSRTTNTVELYDTDVTTSINSGSFTTYTSGGAGFTRVVVVSNVQGDFVAGETMQIGIK